MSKHEAKLSEIWTHINGCGGGWTEAGIIWTINVLILSIIVMGVIL